MTNNTTTNNIRNSFATNGNGHSTSKSTNKTNDDDDAEYYPRHKRAPYLHDISDFGICPSSASSRHHASAGGAADGEGREDAQNEDHHGDYYYGTTTTTGGGFGVGGGGGIGGSEPTTDRRAAPTKSASASNLSQPAMRRHSSFARVFSSWGISGSAATTTSNNGPIDKNGGGGENGNNGNGASDAGGAQAGGGADEGGGGGGATTTLAPAFDDSETNPNTLLPPKFRRGTSASDATAGQGRRMSADSAAGGSARDRLGSHGRLSAAGSDGGRGGGGATAVIATRRIPRWALHDESAVVMKDGRPILVGTLLHHHSLLHARRRDSRPQCIVTPTWRLKERMKTVGVCLVLALNIGTDPPDLDKPTPCAKLQCWLDPTSISRAKAKERIGERLEQQYAKWQQRSKLKYRRALDPTVDMVKELCFRMRESAKGERVLLHYNGHGVPRPTANGEIWLFDKHHTNYIPLSVTDLRRWIGKPSVVVLDCSGAGVLMPFFAAPSGDPDPGGPSYRRSSSATNDPPFEDPVHGAEYLRTIRDTIVLCPTAQGEWLPLHPEFPADVFTSCLTTPIPLALRWHVHQTSRSLGAARDRPALDALDDVADAVPGRLADRKTPLGELNWIFTAITDTIAWNVLPGPLFQRLFRQDLLVASMFRNFLLADRVLRGLNCSPSSIPELPSTCRHPLWQAWDLAVETCLTRLDDAGHFDDRGGGAAASSSGATAPEGTTDSAAAPNAPRVSPASARDDPDRPPPSSGGARIPRPPAGPPVPRPDAGAPFFAEQLTAFEIWLEWASAKPRNGLVVRCPPGAVGGTPLPFLRAGTEDVYDGGFLDGGGGAASSSSSQHELDPPQELPIVLQVLLSQAHRVRALALLRRFLDLGPSAVNLALSVGIFPYVLKLLQSPIDEYKHVLIGIWAKVVGFDPSCQEDVVKDRALPHFVRHLRWGLPPVSPEQQQPNPAAAAAHSSPGTASSSSLEDAAEQRTMAAFILSVICHNYPLGQSECINEKLHTTIGSLLQSLESPEEDERKRAETNMTPSFRMWLLICLGNLAKDNAAARSELYKAGLHFRLIVRLKDDDPDVRTAACYALGSLIGTAPPVVVDVSAIPAISVPSMLQQQLQPQAHRAPQASSSTPAFRRSGSAGLVPGMVVPGTMLGTPATDGSANVGSGLMPSLHQGIMGSQGQLFQPQLSASAGGLTGTAGPSRGLMPGVVVGGNGPPMTFGNILSSASPQPPQPQHLPEPKTVYQDERRTDLDLSTALKLAEAVADASPAVRFEALLALDRFVGKYIDAFVSIASSTFGGGHDHRQGSGSAAGGGGAMASIIPVPPGIGEMTEKKMARVWSAVFALHRRPDPLPSSRELVHSIVVAVNKRIVSERARLRNQLRARGNGGRRSSMTGPIDETGVEGDEFSLTPTLANRRNATGMNLSSYGSSTFQQGLLTPRLQRTESAGANAFGLSFENTSPRKGNQTWSPILTDATPPAEEYFYPESKFFAWKKAAFGERGAARETLDPLSEKGAMNKYRKTRNSIMQQKSHLLKESFAVLAERPPAMTLSRSPYSYDESDAAAGIIEREAEEKKRALHLQQVALFRNGGGGGARASTSLLRFHPYEPALVVCGGSDNVSVWNAQTSERMVAFSNGNPKNTRMTSALWVNEASTNLLLTGSSEGTVRIFDGLFEPNDEISREKPSLISSFVAAPDIVTDKRYSSGLVLEFQQCGGRLIAAGNSKVIRCWDIATEKCSNLFESKSDASLTALTTAWDYDCNDGYFGLGPDILVAGYGNGSLRIFDSRSNNRGNSVLYINEGVGHQSRRRKHSEFDEHNSWIVNVSFTTYGGRHEIVSGCVAGSIKFWDLRYSSSVRTIDHKMQMTALAAHSNVPMFATGSPAQFIKIMSHDGMTQQVIRYHEKISGQRIGPVSCLCFHKHMPFLAAGFADEIVSLYAPKEAVI